MRLRDAALNGAELSERDDETFFASDAADAPEEFLTNSGLLAPGDRSLFRVYAINADDRGKGSNVVDITSPVCEDGESLRVS